METFRKNIPKSVRDSLWNSHFGEELNGVCYVCKIKINYHNYHAGHIISVRNGGNNNISNLKTVCSCCNLSMGIENMEDFKKKYF